MGHPANGKRKKEGFLGWVRPRNDGFFGREIREPQAQRRRMGHPGPDCFGCALRYLFAESMAWQASFTELPSSLVEALKITSPS